MGGTLEGFSRRYFMVGVSAGKNYLFCTCLDGSGIFGTRSNVFSSPLVLPKLNLMLWEPSYTQKANDHTSSLKGAEQPLNLISHTLLGM